MTAELVETMKAARQLAMIGQHKYSMKSCQTGCYCASGAIIQAVFPYAHFDDREGCFTNEGDILMLDVFEPENPLLATALEAFTVANNIPYAPTDAIGAIILWNDAQSRTFYEVIQAFDKALAYLAEVV